MSSNYSLAVQNADNTFTIVYAHYVEIAALRKQYNTLDKVTALLAEGDLSYVQADETRS